MAVVGSLEDLSFPDILQVVHVSRQTGTLILSAPDGERRVRFQNGLVCGATLGTGGPELEDLLVARGDIDAAALAAARERRVRTGEALPAALVGIGAVSQETIERVVRDELRSLLRSLVLLQQGEFRFEVQEEPAAEAAGFGLEEGLGPDAILQGVAARRGRPPARERRAAQPRVPRHVLLVIDRAVIRFALREELLRRHFQVEACAAPAAALDLARTLSGRGIPFSLVCDLILPDATGRGWSGGLDLLRQIGRLAPGLPAIMVGEVRDPGADSQARAAGAAGYVPLPDLGGATLAEVGARLSTFCAEVRAALHHPDRLAAGERPPALEPVRAVDQLSLLRGLIGEMHGDEETEIPLLVLRLAGEYFERGVLFSVRDGEAHGTGAFGGEPADGGGAGLDSRIRGVALPLGRGSILLRVAHERVAYVGPIPRHQPNAPLLERLGPPVPAEAAFLPILSGRQVSGILYGDNVRSGRPIGDLKGLEIFLSQAGMVLQNAILQRRLETLAAPRRGSHG